ncbi:unnamed protein product, partial [Gordionus sp. m RMFG-2023]
ASKLSLEERCLHKAWKVRLGGYEEAAKVFTKCDDPKSGEWTRFSSLIKNFVSETNVVAQEKALEAALVFFENAAVASKIVGEVAGNIIQKCFTTKAKSKELAFEILMQCIEMEKQDIVIEELIKGQSNKSPKIIIASTQLLKEASKAFGPKIIPVKPLIKQIPLLLDNRDFAVREETKQLVLIIYQWLGNVIKPALQTLKPIQLQELEAEFAKLTVSGEKLSRQSRFTRSQKQLMAKTAGVAGGSMVDGACLTTDHMNEQPGPVVETEIDPYELLEASDVLSLVTRKFYDNLADKAWQQRKEAMENLRDILAPCKYEPSGDYHELIKTLRTALVKDTNVAVVALAADNLTRLAKGLRKKFSSHSGLCVTAILEKFKEKKPIVVAALKNAIDAIFLTTTLEAISEDVITYLANKNPSVRQETVSFLGRAFGKCNMVTLNKKLVKLFANSLVQTMNDPDPLVREYTAETLGVMMKIVGERAILPLISDLDKIKIDKIKECCQKCDIVPPPIPAALITESASTGGSGGPTNKVGKSTNDPEKSKGKKVIKTGSHALQKKKNPAKKSNDNLTGGYEPISVKPEAILSSSTSPPSSTASNIPTPISVNAGSAPIRLGIAKETSSCEGLFTKMATKQAKEGRLRDEASCKSLKWNFQSPKPEYALALRDQMEPVFGNTLKSDLFHHDFRFHIKALDSLIAIMNSEGSHGTEVIEHLFNCSDLLLKWVSLKFFETNTTLLLKCLEFCVRLLESMAEGCPFDQEDPSLKVAGIGTRALNEIEASGFVPYLVARLGDPKELLRKQVHSTLLAVYRAYPLSRVWPHLLDLIRTTKSAKQRQDAMEECARNVRNFGARSALAHPGTASHLSATVKCAAAFLNDRDAATRSSSLALLASLHLICGNAIFKHTPPTVSTDFEEKIRKMSAALPPRPCADATFVDRRNEPIDQHSTSFDNTSAKHFQGEKSRSIVTSHNSIDDSAKCDSTFVSPPNEKVTKMPLRSPGSSEDAPTSFRPLGLDTRRRLNLKDTSEMNELLYKPVVFPQTLLHRNNADPSRPSMISSGSVALTPNISTARTIKSVPIPGSFNHADNAIVRLRESQTVADSMEALQGLEELLKRKSIFAVKTRLGLLLLAVIDQITLIHRVHLTDMADGGLEELSHLYYRLLNVLDFIFTNSVKGELGSELGGLASEPELVSLVETLISGLVDKRLNASPTLGPGICRKINMLIVKIIENSQPTTVMCAILHLFRECFICVTKPNRSDEGTSDKRLDLAMKCVWKGTKLVARTIEVLDCGAVLKECNAFMTCFPNAFWKGGHNSKGPLNETPIRTIKTLVHSLTLCKGKAILDCIDYGNVGSSDYSELTSYISRVLRSTNAAGVNNVNGISNLSSNNINKSYASDGQNVTLDGIDNPASRDDQKPRQLVAVSQLAKSDQDRLAAIFVRIGDRETSRAGLEALYDFRLTHPLVDIETKLAASTKLFRDYVEKGLAHIAQSRAVPIANYAASEIRQHEAYLGKIRLKNKHINIPLIQDTDKRLTTSDCAHLLAKHAQFLEDRRNTETNPINLA